MFLYSNLCFNQAVAIFLESEFELRSLAITGLNNFFDSISLHSGISENNCNEDF